MWTVWTEHHALHYDQTSEEGIECIKAWLIRFGRKQLWIYQGRITENFENEAPAEG